MGSSSRKPRNTSKQDAVLIAIKLVFIWRALDPTADSIGNQPCEERCIRMRIEVVSEQRHHEDKPLPKLQKTSIKTLFASHRASMLVVALALSTHGFLWFGDRVWLVSPSE